MGREDLKEGILGIRVNDWAEFDILGAYSSFPKSSETAPRSQDHHGI